MLHYLITDGILGLPAGGSDSGHKFENVVSGIIEFSQPPYLCE